MMRAPRTQGRQAVSPQRLANLQEPTYDHLLACSLERDQLHERLDGGRRQQEDADGRCLLWRVWPPPQWFFEKC